MNYLKRLFESGIFCFINMYFAASAFGQCPQSGIKVLSKDCENPKALAIAAINCSSLKVKWQGNKDKTYIVKAWLAADSITELKISEPVCDNNNTCTATIQTATGETVNWLVQAVCSQQDIITYSEVVNGPQATIPSCNNAKVSDSKGLEVYPNPSRGKLTINYYTGTINGNLQIFVFDINGKQVFAKEENVSSKISNQYQIDLQGLAAGSYMLQTIDGSDVRQVKFVLMKE